MQPTVTNWLQNHGFRHDLLNCLSVLARCKFSNYYYEFPRDHQIAAFSSLQSTYLVYCW